MDNALDMKLGPVEITEPAEPWTHMAPNHKGEPCVAGEALIAYCGETFIAAGIRVARNDALPPGHYCPDCLRLSGRA